jgi:hypothetical protein
MKYEKPQIVELASAKSAIQHQTVKPMGPIPDSLGAHTVNAYEADE